MYFVLFARMTPYRQLGLINRHADVFRKDGGLMSKHLLDKEKSDGQKICINIMTSETICLKFIQAASAIAGARILAWMIVLYFISDRRFNFTQMSTFAHKSKMLSSSEASRAGPLTKVLT